MFIPKFSIDNLYSHKHLIEDHIGELPKHQHGTEIAIIGAGISGLIAAYELKKCGLTPVIYEATHRVGGRLYSKHFSFSDSKKAKPIYAELGAMRMPKCSELFYYYLSKFRIKAGNIFPDPGLVDTLLALGKDSFTWRANTPLPPEIRQISKNWDHFILPMVDSVHQKWRQGKLTEVANLWKHLQAKYKNKSFYQVLSEYTLLSEHAKYMTAFGILGIGTGGFQPIFETSFIEILRIILNTYEINQLSISDSLEMLPQKICQEVFGCIIGNINPNLKLNCPAIEINYNHKSKNPILVYNDLLEQRQTSKEYQAIIFTGTSRCAQLIGLTSPNVQGHSLLDCDVQRALREQNLISSSKTFFCVKEKFWKAQKYPQCVISDGINKGTYFLDYPHTHYGVICISYTWGKDSDKIACFDKDEVFNLFKKNLQMISPDLAKKLTPINNEIININWQLEKYYHGAFKLNPPGQLENEKVLYNQYKSVNSVHDTGLYLSGDGIGWSGGWVETAICTAINASWAVLKRLGAKVKPIKEPSGSSLQ